MSQPADLTSYRLGILSRVLAAGIGGYVLVNLANLAFSIILPGEQYKNLVLAMMLSFVFYTLAIIWAFAVRTPLKAWLGLAAVCVPLLLVDLAWYLTGGMA